MNMSLETSLVEIYFRKNFLKYVRYILERVIKDIEVFSCYVML